MEYPGADVLQIDDGVIERIDYRGTEQYQVTKMFLDCSERMLVELFAEEF